MPMQETTVAEIAVLLRDTKGVAIKTCLLIGAGVSRTSGIGLASDFVERIKANYRPRYDRAAASCANGAAPDYGECMAKLTPSLRVELVRQDIDKAKINWGHIGIARLENAGIVDTILTPNFDPLASRACALFNRFPAIYDLAGIRNESDAQISFEKSFIQGSAIFHLHGQHTGFLLLNTQDKLEAQAKRIRPVLDAEMKGKPVIIVGYSGDNDPLVDQIAALAPFNHGLFWVCHNDRDPAQEVQDKLLHRDDCYLVRNMPADSFFTDLANEMRADAPGFLSNPFAHMLRVLEEVQPYPMSDLGGVDLLSEARGKLTSASAQMTNDNPALEQISALMAEERYQEVWDQFGGDAAARSDEERDQIAWAANELGKVFWAEALTKTGTESETLLELAGDKCAAALAIKPDYDLALNNWGMVLAYQARAKTGPDADALLTLAGEKCAAALAIKPEMGAAHYNWATALFQQAKTKAGQEADALFARACEELAATLAIKPDEHLALSGWGTALFYQAKTKTGPEADALFMLAEQKCLLTEDIRPGAGSYNLARIASLRADAEVAAKWLKHSHEKALDFPGCAHIAADSDFDKVRDSEAFQQALRDIGCGV